MNLIEIFRAGTRRDANGVKVTITAEQLQQAVEAYDPAFHESPAVIGHPKHNHPAYGWVKRLELDGEVLKAELTQVDPEFAEMVEKGRFKKVSSSFYLENSPNNPKQGTLYLRHVGFLGAMPPAVKGLRNPEFAESEQGVVDFADWTQATLFRRLRDWMLVKFGQEETDNVLPDYLVSGMQESAVREALQEHPAESTAFHEADKVEKATEPETPLPQGEPPMSQEQQAELERLQKENEQLKAAQAKAEAEKAAAEQEACQAENAAFCEQLISEGRLAPVAKEAALALLNCSATTALGLVPEFNEGESMLTLAKQFLAQQPPVVSFAEIATSERVAKPEIEEVDYAEGTDPASIDADKKVRAYMKQHGVDYHTAFNAIFA